jgi:hypothetical protein
MDGRATILRDIDALRAFTESYVVLILSHRIVRVLCCRKNARLRSIS